MGLTPGDPSGEEMALWGGLRWTLANYLCRTRAEVVMETCSS